jgi:hypothetical protein
VSHRLAVAPPVQDAWRAILDGADRARALALADQLAAALSARIDAIASVHPAIASTIALVMHYLALATGRSEPRARAHRLIERAMAGIAEHTVTAALHHGLSGVAWAISHLEELSGLDDEDPLSSIDDALLDALAANDRWRGDFDLSDGLVGIGVYGLQRRDRPGGRAIVDQVIAQLASLARPSGPGLAFWRAPDRLGPLVLAQFPAGCFDAGMAHGSAGVIAWLADVERAALAGPIARALLDGCVNWLLAQRADRADRSVFPASVGDDGTARHGRIAWCIGDPGIATALYKAACARRDPAWRTTALEVARRAACVPRDRTGVTDPALCHGALGLAHLYNRLWQVTGDGVLACAARRWYADGLDMGAAVNQALVDEATPIRGAAGIALAMLAAATAVEPRWDDLLLLGVEAWHG